MLTRNLLLRIAGPSLFVSLIFLGSCLTAAVYLHQRQSASLQELDVNLGKRRAVVDLLRVLEDLPEGQPVEEESVERRLVPLIDRVRRTADRKEEHRLVAKLEHEFARLIPDRQATSAEQARQEPVTLSKTTLIPVCRELEQFHNAEVDRSENALHRTVTWTAWGLAGMGLGGTLACLALSYFVMRGLERVVLRAGSLAEVGQVAAGMAHELRNPLTAIKMLVQANREDAESQDLPAEDLRVIEQEIRRMEERLNVFIDFARPPRPERRLIDLNKVIEQTLALMGGRARKQRVALKFEPTDELRMEADGEQLRQLLVNLALNALDVMPRGGELEIELRSVADDQVEIAVLDSGPGIASHHLPRLYEPFFTSKETGLGLGLVVSQRIAHDHGGTLHATNRPQGGARFVLRLPVRGKPGE